MFKYEKFDKIMIIFFGKSYLKIIPLRHFKTMARSSSG